ncbi:MAG TPA: rhamnose ABC transporter substrate-binding protein, partial [Phototrophicaceae bacterium]|nr:rhamnose ABC transporter substrate-binding protein [Phototrophicaceae bacterium]
TMKSLRLVFLLVVLLLIAVPVARMQEVTPEPVVAEPGQEMDMLLLPKALGNAVFDQAHEGAIEAHEELENAGELIFNAPADANAPGQIEIIEAAITQGVGAIMISANDYDQLLPSTERALEEGIAVVTWDSPVDPAGEQLFIAQVDFSETGKVMADMALRILGEDGGQFAILSATPDASNQNAWIASMEEVLETDEAYAKLELVATVYGNDDPDDSYNEALGLIDSYPDLKLIMAPTTVGIAAAAKAMQDEDLCGKVAISGLGLPLEMQEFVESGCSQEFALWSFKDLGYLTYYVSYLLATGAIEPEVGVTFEAGRMGVYTIEEDPTREDGLRVLMGPFSVYSAENLEDWAVSE